jgi:hypothetical protein
VPGVAHRLGELGDRRRATTRGGDLSGRLEPVVAVGVVVLLVLVIVTVVVVGVEVVVGTSVSDRPPRRVEASLRRARRLVSIPRSMLVSSFASSSGRFHRGPWTSVGAERFSARRRTA